MKVARLVPVALAAALAGCHGQTQPQTPPGMPIAVPDGQGRSDSLSQVRESPPESGPLRESPFPKIEHKDLASGLETELIEAHALPLVQLRVLIKSGSAADGDLTGVASLTAHMLKDGGAGRYGSRELVTKIEGLGADLGID